MFMNIAKYHIFVYKKTGELLSTRGNYFALYYSAIALWKIFLPFLITTGSERSTRPLGSVNFSPFTAMPFCVTRRLASPFEGQSPH